MLDRYTISLNADELALVLGVDIPDAYAPEYNAAPTKTLPVITSRSADKMQLYNWGLMSKWSNNKAMSSKFFNLHLESVITKKSYQKKIESNRCIVPMDGFYLWKQVTKKKQIPYFFCFPDKRVFAVAGMWEDVDEEKSFTIIIKKSNSQIGEFQEDMPLILDPKTSRDWLSTNNPNDLLELLRKDYTERFNSHTVSPRIGDLGINDISLIDPAPPSDQYGNYTLFS